MTTATALDWLDAADFAPVPTPGDLQEFFGIPPAARAGAGQQHPGEAQVLEEEGAEGALRRRPRLRRGGAPGHRRRRGRAHPRGGRDRRRRYRVPAGATDRAPGSVEEVWRELERLLFRGRYRDALDRVQRYDERWGQYPAFVDVRSLVILEAAKNVPGLNFKPGVLEFAIAGARQVLQQIGPTEARYLTLVELLEVAGRPMRSRASSPRRTAACRRSPPPSGFVSWRSASRRRPGPASCATASSSSGSQATTGRCAASSSR